MSYDAPPTAPPQPPQPDSHPRGFLGFMTTLPGILTAIAGVLSAGGTAVGIYLTHQDGGSPQPSPSPTVLVVQPAPAPTDPGQVDQSNVSTASSDFSSDPQVESDANDCLDGDDTACVNLLDDLAGDCYDGDGAGCDALYEISEDDSDYQNYGATCGGRYEDWTYADQCRLQ